MNESEQLEFKSSPGEWKEIVETVSAFSNGIGGKILVGVSNSGKPIGITIGKNTVEDLTNKIVTNTEPKVYPEITLVNVDEVDAIAINIKPSPDRLVLAFGRPFKRVGKSTLRMSKDEYERAIVEKHREELRFDSRFCQEAELTDINKAKLKEFLRNASTERGLDINPNEPAKDVIMQLKLGKGERITNAAVLLFGKKPQDYFIQAEIKCIRFKGTGVTETMIDMKDIGGNIIDQVIEAEKFIYNHISLTSWIEGGKIERVEKWEYPPKAIREALANAIAHRDYRSSSKVQIRIFDDRIELWNPGRLPEGWTVETLKGKHESIPFNPLIARAFFWIRYIEEVGTGTNKILEWCREWGLPEPDFEYTGTGMVITLKKPELAGEDLKNLDLSVRLKKIIEYLKESGRITTDICAKLLNTSNDTALRELIKLKSLNIIDKRGVGRATYYVLK
jgi:ATP-dependent DNA helicase RecG